MFVDSHCHLDFPDLAGDLDGVLARMRAQQVTHALCISVTLEDFPRVRALAQAHANLYASVGVHPDYTDVPEPDVDTLAALADCDEVVAIGETGLDYYRLQGDLEWQRERFRVHVRAARRVGKPVVIHMRGDAAADTLRILREEGADAVGGVMHCFTDTWETARAALDLGMMISFSGIVTFRNAQGLREVARRVPDEALLIETDSPYLAPVPHRGRTNEPAHVRWVAHTLAEVRGASIERIGALTTANFFRMLRRPAPGSESPAAPELAPLASQS